jgi:hypothetical protein
MKVMRPFTCALLGSLALSEFGAVTEPKSVESEKSPSEVAARHNAIHENFHAEQRRFCPEPRLSYTLSASTATFQIYNTSWLLGVEFPDAVYPITYRVTYRD